jgi:capsular polysaccharide biosynthesis protein
MIFMSEPRITRLSGPVPAMVPDPGFEVGFERGYPQQAQGLTLSGFLNILMRRWPILLACLAVSLVVAWLYVNQQTPIYSSSSTLLLNPPSTTNEAGDVIDQMASRKEGRSLETQIAVLKLPKLRKRAFDILGLSGKDTRDMSVRVDRSGDTSLVAVTVEHPNPKTAQAVANKIPDVYLSMTRSTNQKSLSSAKEFAKEQLDEKGAQLARKERERRQHPGGNAQPPGAGKRAGAFRTGASTGRQSIATKRTGHYGPHARSGDPHRGVYSSQ